MKYAVRKYDENIFKYLKYYLPISVYDEYALEPHSFTTHIGAISSLCSLRAFMAALKLYKAM